MTCSIHVPATFMQIVSIGGSSSCGDLFRRGRPQGYSSGHALTAMGCPRLDILPTCAALADILSVSGNAGQQEPATAAPDELGGSCLRLLHQLAAAEPAAEAMARTVPPAVPVLVAAMGWGVAGEDRVCYLRLYLVRMAKCSSTALVSHWAKVVT